MLAVLPKAWDQIIADEDEMLLEIVAGPRAYAASSSGRHGR
jgi:hypothetical protein